MSGVGRPTQVGSPVSTPGVSAQPGCKVRWEDIWPLRSASRCAELCWTGDRPTRRRCRAGCYPNPLTHLPNTDCGRVTCGIEPGDGSQRFAGDVVFVGLPARSMASLRPNVSVEDTQIVRRHLRAGVASHFTTMTVVPLFVAASGVCVPSLLFSLALGTEAATAPTLRSSFSRRSQAAHTCVPGVSTDGR